MLKSLLWIILTSGGIPSGHLLQGEAPLIGAPPDVDGAPVAKAIRMGVWEADPYMPSGPVALNQNDGAETTTLIASPFGSSLPLNQQSHIDLSLWLISPRSEQGALVGADIFIDVSGVNRLETQVRLQLIQNHRIRTLDTQRVILQTGHNRLSLTLPREIYTVDAILAATVDESRDILEFDETNNTITTLINEKSERVSAAATYTKVDDYCSGSLGLWNGRVFYHRVDRGFLTPMAGAYIFYSMSNGKGEIIDEDLIRSGPDGLWLLDTPAPKPGEYCLQLSITDGVLTLEFEIEIFVEDCGDVHPDQTATLLSPYPEPNDILTLSPKNNPLSGLITLGQEESAQALEANIRTIHTCTLKSMRRDYTHAEVRIDGDDAAKALLVRWRLGDTTPAPAQTYYLNGPFTLGLIFAKTGKPRPLTALLDLQDDSPENNAALFPAMQ